MRKRLLGILVFIFLVVLVFASYGKSLGLSLYGDDWYVISKYFGNFGPGRPLGYLDQQIFTTNYGPQFIGMAILYNIFKDFAFPYFLTSLILRAICAWGLYFFVKKISSGRLGVVVAMLFAVSAVGAETTDWVYNMNSYLGIFFVLVGLGYFISGKSFKQSAISWFWMILGYMTAIIRVYVLPVTLALIVFFEGFFRKAKSWPRILLSSLGMIAPFIFIKILFPGMGFQGIISDQVVGGLKVAQEMIANGRFDFLLYPFLQIGRMMFPFGIDQLWLANWRIYPISAFLLTGSLIAFMGFIIIYFSLGQSGKKGIIVSLSISFLTLLLLKIFVRYQGEWGLREFHLFTWTFTGIVLSFVMFYSLIRELVKKNGKDIAYWTVAIICIFSFILTWSYNPQAIIIPQHRYLILSSVGLAMVWGTIFLPARSLFSTKLVFLVVLMLVQIMSSRFFFQIHLNARNFEMAQSLFSQIKKSVTSLPNGRTSVFYFEDAPPLVYEELFRFGFGYHMHLLYGLEFDEKNFPYSVANINDLIAATTEQNFGGRLIGNKTPTRIDDVYAFKMERGQLVDVTAYYRNYLRRLELR